METTERALLAKCCDKARQKLIEDNINFIIQCASVACRRPVNKSDEVFSEALVAFNEAIDRFDEGRSGFLPFARICIRSRVIDLLRSQGSIPVILSLDGAQSDMRSYDAPTDDDHYRQEVALEIYSLRQELRGFDIEFSDLPAHSPRTRKTRLACIDAAKYIVSHEELLTRLRKRRTLPSSELTGKAQIGVKVLERYRKYIITGVLIINGGYDILKGYFCSEDRK